MRLGLFHQLYCAAGNRESTSGNEFRPGGGDGSRETMVQRFSVDGRRWCFNPLSGNSCIATDQFAKEAGDPGAGLCGYQYECHTRRCYRHALGDTRASERYTTQRAGVGCSALTCSRRIKQKHCASTSHQHNNRQQSRSAHSQEPQRT